MRSIVIDESNKTCLLCGSPDNIEKHHMVHGVGRRKPADEQGLWCWLCHFCHENVHMNRELDMVLIQMAQKKFEESHSREEFMKLFGRNYL